MDTIQLLAMQLVLLVFFKSTVHSYLQFQFDPHVPTAPGQPYPQAYYRAPDPESISQETLQQLIEHQKTLASGAILRAVQHACAGKRVEISSRIASTIDHP